MSITAKEKKLLATAISNAKKRNQMYEINMEKDILDIFGVVRDFIKSERVLCYGGTAINAALDPKDKFYDEIYDLPDYDFFSTRAMDDARRLTDIYAKKKYMVEAKAGQHFGTYKVFVNFLPVADITQCNRAVFDKLWKKKLIRDNIPYVPPDFLRWSMYLELSRPMGDISRWDKVYNRLRLLDAKYPLPKCTNAKASMHMVPRKFESYQYDEKKLHLDLKKILIEEGVIFFGHSAFSEYTYMYQKKKKPHAIDFEVISTDIRKCESAIEQGLSNLGYSPVYVTHHDKVDDFVPVHFEVRLGQAILVHVYESSSCHSYNVVLDNDLKMNMRVASIETLLSFYLIFLYVDHYNSGNRILCMAQKLTELQKKHKHETTGLLKRFTIECHGTQKTKKDIMHLKYNKFKQLVDKRYKKGDREYDMWFLNYKSKTNPKNLITSNKNRSPHRMPSPSISLKTNDNSRSRGRRRGRSRGRSRGRGRARGRSDRHRRRDSPPSARTSSTKSRRSNESGYNKSTRRRKRNNTALLGHTPKTRTVRKTRKA